MKMIFVASLVWGVLSLVEEKLFNSHPQSHLIALEGNGEDYIYCELSLSPQPKTEAAVTFTKEDFNSTRYLAVVSRMNDEFKNNRFMSDFNDPADTSNGRRKSVRLDLPNSIDIQALLAKQALADQSKGKDDDDDDKDDDEDEEEDKSKIIRGKKTKSDEDENQYEGQTTTPENVEGSRDIAKEGVAENGSLSRETRTTEEISETKNNVGEIGGPAGAGDNPEGGSLATSKQGPAHKNSAETEGGSVIEGVRGNQEELPERDDGLSKANGPASEIVSETGDVSYKSAPRAGIARMRLLAEESVASPLLYSQIFCSFKSANGRENFVKEKARCDGDLEILKNGITRSVKIEGGKAFYISDLQRSDLNAVSMDGCRIVIESAFRFAVWTLIFLAITGL